MNANDADMMEKGEVQREDKDRSKTEYIFDSESPQPSPSSTAIDSTLKSSETKGRPVNISMYRGTKEILVESVNSRTILSGRLKSITRLFSWPTATGNDLSMYKIRKCEYIESKLEIIQNFR